MPGIVDGDDISEALLASGAKPAQRLPRALWITGGSAHRRGADAGGDGDRQIDFGICRVIV